MATIPLPNPALADAARDLLRVLDDFENALPGATFDARSPDGRILVSADGRGLLAAISVDPSLIPSQPDRQAGAWLAIAMTTVANAALLQATGHSIRTLANVARSLTLAPALPSAPTPPPNWPSLLRAVWLLGAKLTSAVTLAKQKIHVAAAAHGQITVSAHGVGVMTNLEIEPSFFASVDRLRLGDLVVHAANQALSQAYRSLDCDVAAFAGSPFSPS